MSSAPMIFDLKPEAFHKINEFKVNQSLLSNIKFMIQSFRNVG